MTPSVCNSPIDSHGRELAAHGTTSFPIGCYQNDFQIESIPWHWHDELEVILIIEGQASITIGSEKHLITQGNGVFINSGILHACNSEGGSACIYRSIVFHPRLIGGSMDSVFWQKYIHPLVSNSGFPFLCLKKDTSWSHDALCQVENAWLSCIRGAYGYEFEVRQFLSRLIFLLNSHNTTSKSVFSEKEIRNSERIKQMLQYIQEHYAEDLNTEKIAGTIMVSPSECLRCFHATIGTTPIQYVKQLRIQKAAELLHSTDLKVSEIGFGCGFQEMSYFAKSFREVYGCTPSEYRESNP